MTIIIAVCGFSVLGYTLSRLLRRNDIADVLWGLGFIALVGLLICEAGGWSQLNFSARLISVLVALWGLRLSTYIGLRFISKAEDVRYANWRRDWGSTEPWRAFLQVFLLQGLILAVIAWPLVHVIQANPKTVGAAALFGVGLFALGFILEAGADAQMSNYKKNRANAGRPLREGLWGIVRHPNYLGEILIWWGLYLIAADSSGGAVTIVSPLLLTFLLNRVSGVTMLDSLLKDRGPEYQSYIQETPALCPLRREHMVAFLILFVGLPIFDFVWLGLVMNEFYIREVGSLARLSQGTWDPLLWAAVAVYVFLALGLQIFSVAPSKSALDAAIRGGLFGICTYAVYDFTNLALVKDWSAAMAAADILWGGILCAITAYCAVGASSGAVKPK